MSLKTAVLSMLVVGLLELSSAFILTAPRDDTARMPDFRFKRSSDKYGAATLNTTEGTLSGYDAIKNTTAWGFHQGSGFKAIQQVAKMPDLNATYPNTTANFAIFIKKGKNFVVALGGTSLNITVKATGSDKKCNLQVLVSIPDLSFETDMSSLGFVGYVFHDLPPLRAECNAALKKYLNPRLANKLPTLVKTVLATKVDLDNFCVNLLAATPTNFPQPKFN